MTDNETLGDALGPGVTKDDLAETERVLKRFEAVAMDEFDDDPQWITTAHRAVCRALEHYDSELGQSSDPDAQIIQIDSEAIVRMARGDVDSVASRDGDVIVACKPDVDGTIQTHD